MDRAHLDSTLALHHRLPAAGDLCWSPYSVAAALGLAAGGARGETRAELARVLAGEGSLSELSALLAASAQLPDAEAAVVNSLWLDRRLRLHAEYERLVREQPGGALHAADFRHRPEDARREINDDVEGTTRGLIRELIGPGLLSPETAAVIVNALYLKVAWVSAFPEAATSPASFRSPTGVRSVPMMRHQETFQYAEADGWRLATLPTEGAVVVDVVLPPESAGVGEVPPLPADVLRGLHRSARAVKLELQLPRFRVERALTLNQPLRELGAVAPFEPDRADFSGITPDEQIFIDLVLHKAVLRVDEQGFEGAAATAVVMRMVSMDLRTPVPFLVDRPFLMLVRHRDTGVVYFLARVVEP
jgi:serine protease inhibitor